MKRNQIFALVIALIMAVTLLFTGCSSTAKPDTAGTTPHGSVADASASTAAAEPTQKDKPMMDISIALWDLAEFGNDDIGKKIADDMKVKLNVIPYDWGNYAEQQQLWAASNNLPDVMGTYTVDDDITRFYGWQDSGLTRTIPEEMIAKYPTVKKLFDQNDIEQTVKGIKKAYYAIPRPNSIQGIFKFDQGVGFYYRKDWLANVGLTQEPKTLDEFYDMLKKFTLNDPDQNKVNDTYGMTCSRAPYMTFCWWGVNPESWIQEDGKWIPGFASKKVLPALQFWNKVYKEKLIDPEFATNNNNQNMQKFSKGTFGVCAKNVDDWSIYTVAINNFAKAQNIKGADAALEKVSVLGPITVDPANPPIWPRIMDTSGTEISAKVDDAKLERIMELFEYLNSPEMLKMLRYGFEGKEYVMNGDQIVPMTNPQTGLAYQITTVYPSANILELLTWDMDNSTISPAIPQPVKDLAQKVRDEFNPIASTDNLAVRLMSTPAKDATWVDFREGFTTLMMTTGDVAQAYDKWVKEQMDKGMSKAIEEVNAEAAKQGIK